MNTAAKSVRSYRSLTSRTVYPILLMVSITHLLNDMMQSVIPAVYPLLKEKFDFTFAQIGLITLVFQLTSSLLQPVAGLLADRHFRSCIGRACRLWSEDDVNGRGFSRRKRGRGLSPKGARLISRPVLRVSSHPHDAFMALRGKGESPASAFGWGFPLHHMPTGSSCCLPTSGRPSAEASGTRTTDGS